MTFESKKRYGPKRKLDSRATRNLVQIAINNPRMTLKSLATPSKSGKKLHYHTVAIILKSFGKTSVDYARSLSLLPCTNKSVGSIAGKRGL